MGEKGRDIGERLIKVAVRVVKLVEVLPRTTAGKTLGSQVLRSATSAGANFEESRGAESKKDFEHKLGIVLKELRETCYWLRIISAAGLVRPARLSGLTDEVEERCRVIASSLVTSRSHP